RPMLLRPGGVSLEEIESVVGTVETQTTIEENRPTSPGQLSRHYSPATPLELLADAFSGDDQKRVGLLSFQQPRSREGFAAIEVLSAQVCLRESVVNLFAALRRLDALGLDYIAAERVPEEGVGRAIMDRLRRAATRGADRNK